MWKIFGRNVADLKNSIIFATDYRRNGLDVNLKY